jgi:hypothetical protein
MPLSPNKNPTEAAVVFPKTKFATEQGKNANVYLNSKSTSALSNDTD